MKSWADWMACPSNFVLVSPRRADAIIAQFICLVSCVPALRDLTKLWWQRLLGIGLEPAGFHHAPSSGAGDCWY
jgi:hypothetical protein